ncbi:ATP-dependent helicase HrpB [Sandaracinobacteroides hominis]|uniref:ATP-dependent helicase HrpB n=1 Tax=Sandaracinobacteroides hominis TaxID=2780086 RepID=UPI002E2AD056|nr:ATP-dependent helicase HrpB [Sandaracinobacteroides hominis]
MEEILPALRASLAACRNAVLVAPPGAGKTSLVAPSLLSADWLDGQRILLMLPRRLAARAAAERIAALLGEAVGQRVGYRTRLESKPGSRIECVTEGLFVNRLLGDPGLEGIGALLFDEVHERNLEGDLGLALALDAQQLRPDLRIVAMSATLDGARFSRLMGACPVLESDGRQYPVRVRHAGRSEARIEDRMASAIHAALREEQGNILAFLPGVGEIERTAERLTVGGNVALHKLHGQADPSAQRAALAPEQRRKLVLATSIAETSVTIDGVHVVIDSGLARRPRFDRASGLTRLVTERVSQAAATQRAGRAGRQAPGVAIRLWEEGETRGFIPFDPPEILEADLSPLLLRLAAWGVREPNDLNWLDAPPASAVNAARDLLSELGALDAEGRLTPHGRLVAQLPLAPRIAHMILAGAARGQAGEAADLAIVLEERGLGGQSTDIEERLRRLPGDRGQRAGQARKLAQRWAELARRLQPANSQTVSPALLLAEAFPDRVAKRRRAAGPSDATVDYLLANGRGAAIEAGDPLARQEWLVVADAGGAGAASRIRLAAAIPADELPAWLEGRTRTEEALAPDPASGRLAMLRTTRLGAIEVARVRAPATREAVEGALLADARAGGLAALPLSETELAHLARMRFAAAHGLEGLPDLTDAGLMDAAALWLAPRLTGVSKLADARLDGALLELLDWQQGQALERHAPARFASPAGTSHVIDYAADGGPEVEVRAQALFGLSAHPMLAGGKVPLALALTSPAGRPLAKTRDLPAFWKGAWKDVQREMKGRYPKHPWPDNPAEEKPTVRTKAADARRS